MDASIIDKTLLSNIGVFRLDNIGDGVLTSALLRNLRQELPQSRITVFAWEGVAKYFQTCPYVNSTVALPRIAPSQRQEPEVQAFIDKFGQHFSGAFDLAVNPRSAPDHYYAGLLVARTEAEYRLGFRQTDFISDFNPNPCYNYLINTPPQRPVTEINLEVLRALGIEPGSASPEVWIDNLTQQRADELLDREEPAGGFCAVTIGAADPFKIWPCEQFSEIVSFLAARLSMVSVLIGSGEDRECGEFIKHHNQESCIDLTGRTTLSELAGVVKRCHLYVGNDTGPKHFAAALGVPVVEITGLPEVSVDFPYDTGVYFQAYDVRNVIIRPTSFFSRQEVVSGQAIESITVEVVEEKIQELLGLQLD